VDWADGDMKAYKFRSANAFERIVDILVNRRLYCSPVEFLNDINEADIRVGNDRGREAEVFQFGMDVDKELDNYRVCSLSKTFYNRLLWTHYGGGSSGLAIEIDLPDTDAVEVSYDDDFIYLSDYIDRSITAAVPATLSRKEKLWQYEEEVRIITRNQYYYLSESIARVIIGSRMSQSCIKELASICSAQGIDLERAIVADWGIYTIGVQGFG
jgi:hypothetical protein